jgi:hypothetical protein
MNSISRRILMMTMFAAATTLTAVTLATSAVGTSMITPAFAQGDNMTVGGNATEGNMTAPDTGGAGLATPPVMTP